MKSLALALVLCAVPSALAQPPAPTPPPPPAPTIKLPDKITIKAGQFAEIKAEVTGKAVKWIAITPGLSIHTCDGGRTAYVTGLPGVYELLAVTAAGDQLSDHARTLVVIGDPPPPPPPPAPPVPPAPPAPPPPADPLQAKLAAAFSAAAGTPAQKKEWAKDLAALYRAAAKLSNDPTVTSAATLKAKLSAAAGALVGDTALREVRTVVAGELAVVLPTAEADLTADHRAAAAALFSRFAAALEDLGR